MPTENTEPQSSTSDVLASSKLQAALVQVRPELAKISKGKLIALNIDITRAITLVLGALPKVRLLRDVFATELAQFDITLIDKLETYCWAAVQAETSYRITIQGPVGLKALVNEALKLRELLLSDVTTLIKRGRLNKESILGLRGVNGYTNIASDLLALGAVLRSRWETVASKSAVEEADLDRAEVLAERVITLVGLRKSDRRNRASFSLERRRAFTLLVQTYDHVRRAVSYVRWYSNDLEEIAPSVYSGRSKGKRKKVASAEAPSVSPPETSSVVASLAALEPHVATEKVAVGLPGADPFA
jgi:hypothetical protein